MSPSTGKTDMEHQEYSPSEMARCKTKDLPNHHSYAFVQYLNTSNMQCTRGITEIQRGRWSQSDKGVQREWMNILKPQTDQNSRFKYIQRNSILQEVTLSYRKGVLGIQIPLSKSVCKAMLLK